MPAVIDAPAIAVLTLGVVAAMVDVSTRKVPNALTFGAAAVGFAFGLATNGLAGLGWSLAGWAVACCCSCRCSRCARWAAAT